MLSISPPGRSSTARAFRFFWISGHSKLSKFPSNAAPSSPSNWVLPFLSAGRKRSIRSFLASNFTEVRRDAVQSWIVPDAVTDPPAKSAASDLSAMVLGSAWAETLMEVISGFKSLSAIEPPEISA